jgi:polysaccharide deacetylase family protein (PEP-CTERM system associated)
VTRTIHHRRGTELAGWRVRYTDRIVEQMPRSAITVPSILSVDVEDWYHILDVSSAPPMESWQTLPSRVEMNFRRLLDLFEERQAHASCFFLGWVAERFPQLVREAARRGYEIASHGYAHRLVHRMTRDEFYADALRARKILEDVSGTAVGVFRSAGFSVTEDTPWFFAAAAEAGYQDDSPIFPARHGHGAMRNSRREPYRVEGEGADLFGKPVSFFGGGYLRVFPYALTRRMARLESLFSSFNGVRAAIEPAARYFLVTASLTAPPAQ